ncbi:odorant receptor Or1 isoform X2 [Diachasma alloeum]|uniref:odorant receptor Or1 isoform X2 n=1 Tax=Diachasma alloeum TaxID=454923 RepID=UPI000738502C|nr:odorant receptor Or1 isoform X2 [Diachasma alloeum]
MNKSEYKPVNAFKLNLTIWKYAGIWPAGVKNKSLRYIYYIYNSISPTIWFGSFFILQFIHILMVITDLEKLMHSIYLMISYCAMACKYHSILWYRRRLEELFNTLNEPIFKPRLPSHFDVMNESMRIARRDSIIFLSSGICATIFWTFWPLFDKKSEENELAYNMWCPLDISRSPTFELVYAYQTIAITYNTMFNTMTDTVICGLLKMMSGHLDVLIEDYGTIFEDIFICPGEETPRTVAGKKLMELENVAQETEKQSEMGTRMKKRLVQKSSNNNSRLEIPPVIIPQISQEDMKARVSTCVEFALAIERFANEIKDIFQAGILVQFIASCLIVCASLFALTILPPKSFQFFSLAQYLACMLIQIFLYCWRGNEVSLKFSDLADAIYTCDWTSCDERFRRSMDIIMSRSQKPVILLIGGLFSLSVETFISILKSAYSFFMFFKEVQNMSN